MALFLKTYFPNLDPFCEDPFHNHMTIVLKAHFSNPDYRFSGHILPTLTLFLKAHSLDTDSGGGSTDDG